MIKKKNRQKSCRKGSLNLGLKVRNLDSVFQPQNPKINSKLSPPLKFLNFRPTPATDVTNKLCK